MIEMRKIQCRIPTLEKSSSKSRKISDGKMYAVAEMLGGLVLTAFGDVTLAGVYLFSDGFWKIATGHGLIELCVKVAREDYKPIEGAYKHLSHTTQISRKSQQS